MSAIHNKLLTESCEISANTCGLQPPDDDVQKTSALHHRAPPEITFGPSGGLVEALCQQIPCLLQLKSRTSKNQAKACATKWNIGLCCIFECKKLAKQSTTLTHTHTPTHSHTHSLTHTHTHTHTHARTRSRMWAHAHTKFKNTQATSPGSDGSSSASLPDS